MEMSIVIPTYNRTDALVNLVPKLQEQLCPECEIIVVDDGSNIRIDQSYPQLFLNPHTHYIFQENQGVSAARNKGASIARGKYLIFLDDDDEVTSDWLPDFLNYAEKDLDMVFCFMLLKKSNGMSEVIKIKENVNSLKKIELFASGSWMLKKSLFRKVGSYDVNLKYAENTELIFRLSQETTTIGIIPRQNLIYHQSQSGGSKNTENIIKSLSYILSKHEHQLSKHLKFLYHQIIGVNKMRMGHYKDASESLHKAYQLKFWKIDTLIRFFISKIPILAAKLYPPI